MKPVTRVKPAAKPAAPEEAKPKTLLLRIAVVVDEDGDWSALGWANGDDEYVQERALDDLNDRNQWVRLYWLEAELALPEPAEPVTVQATVSEVQP